MTKDEKFKKFWELYPRKIAKLATERAWKKLTLKQIDSIAAVYKAHLLRWKYKEIQFVPHASTWLNQRRWEDELEPLPNESQPFYKNLDKQREDFIKKMKKADEEMASEEEIKKALGLKK
jgi:hypothetical protein